MRLSWKVGRVAGIDLYLHATLFLLLAWIWRSWGGIDAVLLTSAVFGCVLLHELGHALTARYLYNIPTNDITLYPIGGVATLQRMPRKPGAELLVTLAGPLVNLLIGGALALALGIHGALGGVSPGLFDPSREFFASLMWINFLLAGFNMIPAFPMDGGRVLRAILSSWLGRLRATEIAVEVGRTLALAFGLWSIWNGDLMRVALATVIYMLAGNELAQVRSEDRGGRSDGSDEGPPRGYRWTPRGAKAWQLVPIWVDGSARRPSPPRPW